MKVTSPGVLTGSVLVSVFLMWRVSVGADVGDGTHVVAMAMRMSQGDVPLSDEMNLQSFGSIPAIPCVWLWLKMFGVEGIVLASRYFYLCLVAAAAVTGYRALRTSLPPAAAFTAVVLMFTPAPYGLMVTSYNTVPALGFGLAVCAAFAAMRTSSTRWALLAGTSIAIALLGHPSSMPPVAVLAVTVAILARRHRRVLLAILLSCGSALTAAFVLIALGPGVSAFVDTVVYTAEYQSLRPEPLERLDNAKERYWEGLLALRHVPAIVLAAVALLPGIRPWWRCVAAIGVAPAVAVAAWAVAPPDTVSRQPFGLTSGAFALLVVFLLFLPVVVRSLVDRQRDVLLLATLTTPVAVVGVVSYSMISSAGVVWGVAVPPVLPLFGALGAGIVLWAREQGPRALAPVAAVAMVGSLIAVHPIKTFMNPDPRHMSGRIASGPLAGLLTDANYLHADCELRALTQDWIDPEHDSVFFYARSGGYAYTEARMSTNIVWISAFEETNHWTVDWWNEKDRWPDVAVVYPAAVKEAGGWDELAAEDPLIAALDEKYGKPVEAYGHLVLRRDGQVRSATDVPKGCAGILG